MSAAAEPARARHALLVLAGALALAAFAVVTPPEVLAKLDAIAYAVCHRIESHSFTIAGRQLPLCARCTGIFVGAALTLAVLAVRGRGRSSRLPGRGLLAVLLGFSALMAVDGLNSYAGFFPGLLPQAYAPQNWLRLLTGTLHGIALAALVVPLFGAAFWREPRPEASVGGAGELGALLLAGALLVALTLSGSPALLVPLALLSAAGVLALLTLVNTTLLLVLFRRENRVTRPRDGAWPLLAGLTATLLFVTAIDAVRFALTGTWSGLPL
jgi:uncharacterized membrane protein